MTININNPINPNNNKKALLEQNKEKVPMKLDASNSPKELAKDTVELSAKTKSKRDDYNDPLMKWPYRGLAFTNDIGAAVMDIAPTLGTMLWVPALMYFGADIYDKYKSDQKEYEPSGKRAFKQAVFQACASVMMPIIVVHNGQKAASMLAQKSKDGMSLQLKEEVEQFTVHHLKRRKLKDYEGNVEGFKKEFNEHLKQHLLDREKSFKTKNPLKLLSRWIFGSKHGEKMTDKKLVQVQKYSNKNIDEMFAVRDALLHDRHPKSLSNKLLKLYDTTKREFAKDKNTIEGYVEDTIKTVLKQRQRDRLFKTKLWKTAGGFVALGATIQFIDHFVEDYIIKKVVEPGLDNFSNSKPELPFKNFGKLGNKESDNVS